jgi:hypothetical protein
MPEGVGRFLPSCIAYGKNIPQQTMQRQMLKPNHVLQRLKALFILAQGKRSGTLGLL